MAQHEDHPPAAQVEVEEDLAAAPARRGRRIALMTFAGLLLAAVLAAWLSRERIADNVIAGRIEALGLPATYEIENIGTGRQVLRNIVIGDPARPDLTIARASVAFEARWGMPGVGRITLEQPRLHGRWRDGRVSFGSLDRLIYTGRDAPFRLPDLDLAIRDGRALIESEEGSVGIKLEGAGRLRSGFAGIVAAVAPQAALGGCVARGASLYGKLSVADEKPRFAGPVRLGALDCPAQKLQLGGSAIELDTTFDARLDGAEGRGVLAAADLAYGGISLAAASGATRFSWRKGALNARYDLAGTGIASDQLRLASAAAAGAIRRGVGFARFEIDGDVTGSGVEPGAGFDRALVALERDTAGSLAAPLAGQLRRTLRRETPGSSLAASFLLRGSEGMFSLVAPQASLRGGSGAVLLSVSRLQLSADGKTAPRLAGNFATGGEGLPRIVGRMERSPGGGLVMRLAMAEYAAGPARLAVPQLTLVQSERGALGFSGLARLSGPLPGGAARNLVLPLDGNWSPGAGLAVGRECTAVRFDSLSYANLTLSGRSVTLCPQPGGAMLRANKRGLRLAAGATSLTLAGRLGATPIRIASGPVGFAYPGSLAARSLDIALGPPATASRFRIANLSARIGEEIAGKFAGSEVYLAKVPLDLLDAGGDWRFAGGRLAIANAGFRIEDRDIDDRFQPMTARGASLSLADNRVLADAVLREPESDREVVRTAIRHDLASGAGNADLAVDGIVLDGKLQPEQISRLALGVIANAEGTVRGRGRIDWNGDAVTSTGTFATDDLDFAAAFGPVKRVSGSVVFTDLLGIVTAPDQRLRIGSINPGIEVEDGELSFALEPDGVLAVNGASWPFLDGRLTLEPTSMVFGQAETRRFTLRIEALDAAKLVERLDMGNINASGIFDGGLPLVFDENGGHIAGGVLVSRPPGGNVSYVGELTYKDLSAMANFAFDALRSIDYRAMRIEMNGPLEGEIITRVSFDGIRQGVAARRNFITERIAKLPIKFNINLRAPFFKLVRSFKSLYDPSYVIDPRTLGLVGADGKPLPGGTPASQPPAGETAVQAPVSGQTP